MMSDEDSLFNVYIAFSVNYYIHAQFVKATHISLLYVTVTCQWYLFGYDAHDKPQHPAALHLPQFCITIFVPLQIRQISMGLYHLYDTHDIIQTLATTYQIYIVWKVSKLG